VEISRYEGRKKDRHVFNPLLRRVPGLSEMVRNDRHRGDSQPEEHSGSQESEETEKKGSRRKNIELRNG